MLKASPVRLVTAQPVCPGKYLIMIQGAVAAVKTSVDAGASASKESLVDSKVIPKIHPRVFSALSCATEINNPIAVGVVETFSLVSAILAADHAVKAAAIDLIEIRLGRGLGGKSYLLMSGDVSSVKFAVDSTLENWGKEGSILKTVVIPSPHPDMIKTLF